MKILKNKWDEEFEENNINDCKQYFKLDDCNKEDYTGDDFNGFCREIEQFNADLNSCSDLEEVARLLNSVSDRFFNGTEYYVKEI